MVKIYARNTEVKSIELDTAQNFVHEHHRQQTANPSTRIVNLGIFYKDELMGVSQFCSPRTSAKKREYTTELLRMCFKKDVQIIGGASKMITAFIRTRNPSDIFTYQDTTGESTDVYEKCGFTMVSQDKKKQYLVRDGKTRLTATKNEIHSVAYAVSLGPDKILSSELGEVFKEDGSRKTNIELFLDLGWHIEETTGDKVYEWVNPNVSFYTYKITATDSDKYYYGVRSIKIPFAELTEEDCLNDNYMGSGGMWSKNNKFTNWKNKHKDHLEKTVLKIFDRKSTAYAAEKKTIGDLWLTDPLCLNTIAGGSYTGIGNQNHDNVSIKTCAIHGETKHIGEKCRKCINSKNITMRECLIHGLTKHNLNTCYQCVADKNVSIKKCSVHGEAKHLGNTCQKCANSDLIMFKECVIHGQTKHRGANCSQCTADKAIVVKECAVHGLTKHHKDQCSSCLVEKNVAMKICEIHGETKHYGNSCYQCRADNNIQLKECSVHGKVKHIGEICYSCRSTGYTTEMCETHGKTSFRNGECVKCKSDSALSMSECSEHGMTKHYYGQCKKCLAKGSIIMGECSFHGLVKHRADKCSSCTADKGAHRHHTAPSKTKKNCHICAKEIDEGVRPPIVEESVVENVCQLCEKSFKPKSKKQLFCSNPHDWNCAVCGTSISPIPRKGKKLYSCFGCRRELTSMMNNSSGE